MGIPLLQGRDFLPGETAAVIISRGFRDRHFRNSDPLQGQISMDGEHEPFYPVVGVVGEVHHSGLAQPTEPEMYFPAGCPKSGGEGPGGFTVAVRTTVRPEAMAKALKQALRELDPDLPLGKVGSMAEALTLDRQNAEARSVLLGSFAGLALVLAGVGIYAVMAFLTGLRTREIGVRMALGAQLRDVLTLVVGQGLRMALTGIGIGVAIALLMGRTLGTLISGVPFWDPATLAAVVMVLFLTAALACLWPALRAAKVSPMVALRNE
jgi:predicted lysophospholipase L1 biosynthesis ABC-type transport system permease subunit